MYVILGAAALGAACLVIYYLASPKAEEPEEILAPEVRDEAPPQSETDETEEALSD